MKQLIFIVLGFISCLTAQSQNYEFPYIIGRKDILTGSVGIVSCATGYLFLEAKKTLTIEEISNLNNNSINSFDRIATKNWSPKADITSDWLVGGLIVTVPVALTKFGKERQLSRLVILGTMYAENLSLVLGITQTTKKIVGRNRPFLYNKQLSAEDKLDAASGKNDRNSFYSMHTAFAFSSAMFLSKAYSDMYGRDYKFWILTSTAFATASTIGLMRLEAGRHYPSDIITGALVGSAIGYLIPKLHQINNKNLTLLLTPGNCLIVYSF